MITVYNIDKNKVYTGNTKQISEKDGTDKFWVRQVPPSLTDGEYAIYTAGKWTVSSAYPTPAPIIPQSVTMRQARLALLQEGLLSQIAPAIEQLESPQKQAAEIEWEYALTVERHSDLVQTLADILSLTSEQMDDLFLLANSL